jgi:hypothetical protein
MADINGVELSYATKDEYDFEGGEYNDGEVQTAMQNNMNGKWTKENFNEYHKSNPEIYNLFVKFTNMATQRKKYYSAKAIFHRIRWESMISGEGDYKIDDGWISHYARKFMDDFPQHSGFFQTRDRRNSYHTN